MSKSEVYNIDCMEYLKKCRDKEFDLAIVDPPYGVEEMTGRETNHGRGKLKNRNFNQGEEKFNRWDKKPTKKYFDELFRVSKNQPLNFWINGKKNEVIVILIIIKITICQKLKIITFLFLKL